MGVMPGFPKGTPSFWMGKGFAMEMWEVVACPVVPSLMLKDFSRTQCVVSSVKTLVRMISLKIH